MAASCFTGRSDWCAHQSLGLEYDLKLLRPGPTSKGLAHPVFGGVSGQLRCRLFQEGLACSELFLVSSMLVCRGQRPVELAQAGW